MDRGPQPDERRRSSSLQRSLAITDLESARRLVDEGSTLVDLRSAPAGRAICHPLESDPWQGGWVLLLANSYEDAQAYADRLLAGKPVLAVRNDRWQTADPRDG